MKLNKDLLRYIHIICVYQGFLAPPLCQRSILWTALCVLDLFAARETKTLAHRWWKLKWSAFVCPHNRHVFDVTIGQKNDGIIRVPKAVVALKLLIYHASSGSWAMISQAKWWMLMTRFVGLFTFHIRLVQRLPSVVVVPHLYNNGIRFDKCRPGRWNRESVQWSKNYHKNLPTQ